MNAAQIWNNVIAYAAQIGLLVGAGAALPVMLRLRVARARLLHWQLLLVGCVALPWLRPWHSEVVVVSASPVSVTQSAVRAVAVAPRVLLPPLAVFALWLLAAGIAVRIVWLAAGLLKLSRYRRGGQELPLPAEWSGMASRVRVLLSGDISGPVTFGFFRPVVLLPAGFPFMPETMRDAILFHELLHVERRDWLFTLGEELVRAVFWFHPAIWWVLGEIQLAREQTVDQSVIEMTHARDPYVDTLLAMAGVNPGQDLAPAPLFLRRRHLKQRVMGIVQEVGMSRKRIMLAQAAAVAAMAASCWLVTGAVPLHAQKQMMADGAGVTVNLNGSQVLHRTPIFYPAEALARGVEGTVVVQVRLDDHGEVIDATVLSGPDELRRGVQQSVLNWHFDKGAAGSTRAVNVDFVKAAGAEASAVPAVAAGVDAVSSNGAARGGRGGVAGAFAVRNLGTPQTGVQLPQLPAAAAKIERIDVSGLSDSAKEQLLESLPVHTGDAASAEALLRIEQAARQFDSHLVVSSAPGGSVVRISVQAAPTTPAPSALIGSIPAGAQRIGGNVMAANLVSSVKPVYPPLAKMARMQGTVRFQATIGKDGTIEDLALISGPPLLVPAAMEAVKQWVYKPTLLNGAAVEVVTTIDISFTLADSPAAVPPQ